MQSTYAIKDSDFAIATMNGSSEYRIHHRATDGVRLYSHDIGACEVVEVIAQHIAQLESASTERIYLNGKKTVNRY